MTSRPVILATLLALASCEREPGATTSAQPWLDPSSEGKLTRDQVRDHYLKADPAADVEAALAKGDRRFICVMGFAATYPGVEDMALVQKHGQWVFPYVTDVIDDRRLHDRAHEYAKEYNSLLSNRLKAGSS